MSIFKELILTWKGTDYTVQPDKLLKLIAQVEDIITLNELYNYSQKGAAPISKLSMAYGVMLRYAGAKVTDEEVYSSSLAGGGEAAVNATQAILLMMLPQDAGDNESAGKS